MHPRQRHPLNEPSPVSASPTAHQEGHMVESRSRVVITNPRSERSGSRQCTTFDKGDASITRGERQSRWRYAK